MKQNNLGVFPIKFQFWAGITEVTLLTTPFSVICRSRSTRVSLVPPCCISYSAELLGALTSEPDRAWVLGLEGRSERQLAGLQRDGPPCTESGKKSHSRPIHCPSFLLGICSKKGRRIFLPLFSPVDDPVLLSNFYAPLEELTELVVACSRSAPQQPAQVRSSTTRKHQISPTTTPESHGKRR
ncbi:hypothetical protein SKAU_G00158990 [Synaphobranchus kaupii]|uniref:Uncharacterized protein n=1 Tax=Synaphobranchus kaupii TaxID=118154 RepID=A0A9Q1FI46_SYNKA|nr:hypothetical protein SKAU_G00158990 [Synaphobranchus kaupii]